MRGRIMVETPEIDFIPHDFAAHDLAMPIDVSSPIRVHTQDEFHEVDRRVMAEAFGIHNEFGRLLDERIFKQIIARRCEAEGLAPVEREVRIRASHGSFAKDYFLDLLFCSGVIVEAKATESLAPAHVAQTLNYLFLTGLNHASLVNTRTHRVQRQFVSTKLTPEQRRRFRIVAEHWQELSSACEALRRKLRELLDDWGAFLEVGLYREALLHFLRPRTVAAHVDVLDGDCVVGGQPAHLLTPDIALGCTAFTDRADAMEVHLRRLLAHTTLRAVQWINFNGATIELRTLTR
jgi:GxxExxY protein